VSPVIARGDRRLLLIGGSVILLLMLVIVLLTPAQHGRSYYPSSYSPGSDGAKAAYLLLEESGYQLERWEKSPVDLPSTPAGHVYILAVPFAEVEPAEKDAIKRFIGGGGRVLAMGMSAGALLPRADISYTTPERFGWLEYAPAIPSRLTSAGTVGLEDAATWNATGADVAHYMAGKDGAVVVSYSYGAGEVIWWGSATPATNAGISRNGNLQLLLNSVGGKDRRVLWDEYFHSSRRSLFAYVSTTPLKWALLQAGVLLLAVLLTFSRRNGPIRPLPRESRLSPLEFVETLGGLYRHAQATPVAIEIMYTRFRHLLARRLGLKSDAPPDVLARAARERLGYNHPGFLKTLQRSEQAMRALDLPEAEAVELVQHLSDHARALKLIPAVAKEKD